MPTYGITSTGIVIKRLADIKTELEASFIAAFGSAHDVGVRSPSGQLIGILSERESLLWELVEQLYNSQYPDTSEGVPLDNVAAITGTVRKEATFSTVVATLFGDIDTVIPAGSVISKNGDQTARFVLDSNVTILAGAPNQVDGNFTAETAGALEAPATTLTVIETPVSGWSTVSNALDAVIGNNEETDIELKLRRDQELSLAGKATLEAIRSAISAIVDVTAVRVFQNNTSIVDVDSRPPHSVDIVVEGSTNQVIAEKIFDTVGAGIQTIGDINVDIIDSQGFTQPTKFSRPEEVLIYLEIDLTTDADFPVDGTTQVENLILAYAQTLRIGDDVIVFPKLISSFASVAGILDLVVRIGVAPAPTLDNNIVTTARQKAVFDSIRTTITEL